MKKETIIQLIIILILCIIFSLLFYITYNKLNNISSFQMGDRPMGERFEEDVEKETKFEDIEEGQKVNLEQIDLNKYNSNITLDTKGEYILNGSFKNSLIIDSKEDVTLVLNGVDINNEITATIINKGTSKLTIKLQENTVNTVSDGGSSEYDSCIYSNGPLVIEGNGTLNVYGNQQEGEGIATDTNDITINSGNINIECKDDGLNAGGDGGVITINGGKIHIKASGDGIDSNKSLVINGGEIYTMGSSIGGDAGIDTDEGFYINGGSVIALGSDMLQQPNTSSKQNSLCYNLNQKISNGTNVSIKNAEGIEIVSFEAKEDFRTLIVSNNNITNGNYYLYKNGEKTDYMVTIK